MPKSESPDDLMRRNLVDGEMTLRPLVARDAGELFLLCEVHRKELRQFMTWVDRTTAVADVNYYILTLNGFWKSGITYGIYQGETLTGTVGFHHSDMSNNKSEIGYWLAPPFQRLGLGTRSVKLAVDAAFRYTSVHRIEAKIDAANVGSIALVKKLGFQFEGVEREGIRFPQGYRDHQIYSILSHEWPES